MSTSTLPAWWNASDRTPWERARVALQRDLDQTWADLGLGEGQDLNQSVTDTVRQALGLQLIPPDHVPNMAVLSEPWADEAIRSREAVVTVEEPPAFAQWSQPRPSTPTDGFSSQADDDVWERALHLDADPGDRRGA